MPGPYTQSRDCCTDLSSEQPLRMNSWPLFSIAQRVKSAVDATGHLDVLSRCLSSLLAIEFIDCTTTEVSDVQKIARSIRTRDATWTHTMNSQELCFFLQHRHRHAIALPFSRRDSTPLRAPAEHATRQLPHRLRVVWADRLHFGSNRASESHCRAAGMPVLLPQLPL